MKNNWKYWFITSFVCSKFWITFLIITFLCLFKTNLSYSQPIVNIDSKRVMPNSGAREISLDLISELFQTAYNETVEYPYLTHLRITKTKELANYNLRGLVSFKAEKIGVLEFEKLNQDDFDAIIPRFIHSEKISKLVIKDCKIEKLPIDLIISKNIIELEVSNCRSLNPTAINDFLLKENNLKKLSLINCGIYDLNFINPKNQIRVLNLSYNRLASLESFIGDLKHLDSLTIIGNDIPNMYDNLESVVRVKPKYVKTDSISILNQNKLRSLDSQIQWDFSGRERVWNEEAESVYGHFKTGKSDFVIYSPAYLQYQSIFSNRLFLYQYDTLTAEEKFWDTLHFIARKRNGIIQEATFRLHRGKNIKRKHITFNFYKKKKLFSKNERYQPSAFFNAHPECTIYRDYQWVTAEPTNSKAFQVLSREDFIDIRFKFHPANDMYTIYLKKFSGEIIEIQAKPIKKNKNKKPHAAELELEADYTKYLSALTKKNRSFDKSVLLQKRRMRTAMAQFQRNAWNTLRTYMSSDERIMSEEDWLKYYFNLISNESDVLKESYPFFQLFERTLTLNGIKRIFQTIDTANTSSVRVSFVNESNINLPITSFYLVNLTDDKFRRLDFFPTINPLPLTINTLKEYFMIIYLPDQSIGIIEPQVLKNAMLKDEKGLIIIKCEVVEKELITIGQIQNTIGF